MFNYHVTAIARPDPNKGLTSGEDPELIDKIKHILNEENYKNARRK